MILVLLLWAAFCSGSIYEIEIHAIDYEAPVHFSFRGNDTLTTASLLSQVLDFCLDYRLHKSSPDCERLLFDSSLSLLCEYGETRHCNRHLDQMAYHSIQKAYIDYWWTKTLDGVLADHIARMISLHRNEIASFNQKHSALREIHQNSPSTYAISPGSGGGHFIDEQRCLHVFYNVMLMSRPIVETHHMPTSFGYFEKSAFKSKQGNCTGNILHSMPYSGYWKEYVFKHYPNMQPLLVSSSLKESTYIAEPHLIIYDRIFCHNIAHVMESTSLFWSAVSTENTIGGIHLLFLETERCQVTPYLFFASFMQRCIVHAASLRGIPVYVRNKNFAVEYMNYYTHSNMNYYSNIVERDDSVIYSILLDRPYHWHTTRNGLRMMKRTMRELCTEMRNVVEYSDVVIAARNGARHISNLDEVVNVMQKIFVDDQRKPGHVAWTVRSVDMGSLDVCEQIELVSNAKIFVCVHGSECALSGLMDPQSAVIELHPGCCIEESLDWFFTQLYQSAELYYTYFTATYVSNIHCMHYYPGMLSAKYCGTFVDTDSLVETIHEIKNLLMMA